MVEMRLRYHLARGEFYKHWQLKNTRRGKPVYFNPEDTGFTLEDVKLYNRRYAAQKIYEGANKGVCAWLAIKGSVRVHARELDVSGMTEISYNPRVAPFWTYKAVGADLHLIDIDLKEFDKVIINKTKIYVQ